MKKTISRLDKNQKQINEKEKTCFSVLCESNWVQTIDVSEYYEFTRCDQCDKCGTPIKAFYYWKYLFFAIFKSKPIK